MIVKLQDSYDLTLLCEEVFRGMVKRAHRGLTFACLTLDRLFGFEHYNVLNNYSVIILIIIKR